MTKLVPKLRFKEFSGEWVEAPIRKYFKTYSGGTPSTANKSYYGGSIPFIRSAEINKLKTELFLTNEGIENSSAKLVKKGDVLYALYGANSGDVAISKINGAINQAILCLDSKEYSNSFLYYNLTYLKTKITNQYIQGGQGNLSGDIIKSLSVPFPKEPKEQQKIANCLSSLDNLIEAQNKKIEALKKHKKGLMQQLFPQEGEKEPKLRFKEFSGEWEEKTIDELFIYTNGGSFENKIIDDGQYRLITLNSIDINGELKSTHKTISNADTFLHKNDLVMVLSDVAHGNFLGLTAIIPNDNQYVLNQRMGGLRLKKENNIQFIRYFINLNQKYFKTHGHGSSQQNLSKSDILKFIVKIPKSQKEQQKIANCLSSLDTLIEAQSKKIEALKKHKKGLMQQMFVSDED